MVLAGGFSHRLGGVDKPALDIGGQSMLERVLAAVADARTRVVVGPHRPAPADVLQVRENPPGSGPLAAIVAGVEVIESEAQPAQVALLAADLPFLTNDAVRALLTAATDDAAVYVDDHGQRQYLCAVWRFGPLRDQLRRLGAPAGLPLRHLYDDALVAEVRTLASPPPWYDCDTPTALERARAAVERPDNVVEHPDNTA
ncbi:MAG: molybdenum cofactor guanylyltransferase [Micromonosporaceae bacterium]